MSIGRLQGPETYWERNRTTVAEYTTYRPEEIHRWLKLLDTQTCERKIGFDPSKRSEGILCLLAWCWLLVPLLLYVRTAASRHTDLDGRSQEDYKYNNLQGGSSIPCHFSAPLKHGQSGTRVVFSCCKEMTGVLVRTRGAPVHSAKCCWVSFCDPDHSLRWLWLRPTCIIAVHGIFFSRHLQRDNG